MNRDYVRITYQQMLEDFTARVKNDPRFKNMTSASIYYLFMEMLTATMDMTNYYMQRTAEEAFIDTAKLDSSVIKHGKNLGYNPVRNTPAEAEIAVVLRGPLPVSIPETGATIYFPQEEMDLSYNGKKYILNTDYSYTLSREDIINGRSSTWTKTIVLSKPLDSVNYVELSGDKFYNDGTLLPIKVFQGEVKAETIYGVSNTGKLGRSYQFYDIDNIKFSNWYGKRDPNGWFKNQYYKKNSWCKVGIGKNQEDAFTIDNLYDIEDVSIYLNPDVLRYNTEDNKEALNVCSLTTNSDKTIRLRFGDGNIVSNGLNTEDQNIYIQYIECDGAEVNKVGTRNSELKVGNKIWCTFSGGTPVDVTSNIKLLFNGDITNGVDFEDQQSIKNNAPLYFASNNKLVTKQDFVSYFKGLNTPIRVKNAIAWGQDEIEDFESGGDTTYKYIQNCICYCIASSLYNTKTNVYTPINVLTEGNKDNVFSLYGVSNNYLSHLSDYIKFLMSYTSFHKVQYTQNPTQQWLKNLKAIRDDVEPKILLNSKVYSFPPIVQYYDVVGTVTVNSLSKLQEYKRDVENEIYKWLDNNCNFGTKIYKSDIVKFFNKRSETSYVDIDIRVSDIIKSQDVTYSYSLNSSNFDSVFKNNSTTTSTNEYKFDTIYIPIESNSGAELTEDNLKNKTFTLTYSYKNSNGDTKSNTIKITANTNVSSTYQNLIVSTYQQSIPAGEFDTSIPLTLVVSIENDFYSLSNYSINNASSYNLNESKMEVLNKIINEWVENATPTETANRAIPLPYYVESFNGENTRAETILRKGIIQNTYESQLTEKAFWTYLVPKIIKEVYAFNDIQDLDINSSEWEGIDNLILDLYYQFKATFCDSILDDNNNIIHFSMDNEIPVVRLFINYKYGM